MSNSLRTAVLAVATIAQGYWLLEQLGESWSSSIKISAFGMTAMIWMATAKDWRDEL